MELELDLKITRPRDDITSFSNLRIFMDHTGPAFLSRETETMFILVLYLKGFRKENIDISINEDGTRIAIGGRKPVQELVLMGWMMQKKDVELRAFRKVFSIPDGVILDRIKAKYRREEASLTIFMPKLVKGVRGVVIEEVKEVEVGTSSVDDKGHQEVTGETKDMGVQEVEQEPRSEIDTLEPEIAGIQVPSEGKDEGGLKEEEIEPQMERGETSQVEVQVADQREFEVPKTADQEEETGKVVEEQVDVEAKKIREEVPEIVAERVEDKELEKPGVEDAIEEAVLENVETPHSLIKGQPAAEETPKEEEKEQEAPEAASAQEELVEPIRRPESAELTEPEKEHVSQEPEEPHALPIKAEKEQITEPNHEVGGEMLQVSEKPEPEKMALELPTKLEPDTVKEKAEILQPEDQQEQPQEHQQQEINPATPPRRRRKRNRKPCPPLVISGSAIILSLIVLVISLIRAKKR